MKKSRPLLNWSEIFIHEGTLRFWMLKKQENACQTLGSCSNEQTDSFDTCPVQFFSGSFSSWLLWGLQLRWVLFWTWCAVVSYGSLFWEPEARQRREVTLCRQRERTQALVENICKVREGIEDSPARRLLQWLHESQHKLGEIFLLSCLSSPTIVFTIQHESLHIWKTSQQKLQRPWTSGIKEIHKILFQCWLCATQVVTNTRLCALPDGKLLRCMECNFLFFSLALEKVRGNFFQAKNKAKIEFANKLLTSDPKAGVRLNE